MGRPSRKKSTLVRTKLALLRTGFGLAEKVSPSIGGRRATRIWLTVPPVPPTPPAPVGGEPFALRVGQGEVRGISVGSGPVVYLVHGWGGVGHQLSAFVDPLRRNGFRVITFDAPSHGRSDPGVHGPRRTHGVEFATALTAVMRRFGPADTVIAHSMGALPSLMAHRASLPIARLVLLAPMRDLDTHLDRFSGQVGIGPRTRAAMDRRIERLVGLPVAGMDVRLLAAPVPVLVVHDRGDRETWHAHSEDLVETWPGPATMISTDGLGHRRLLADPHVVRHVLDFVGVAEDRPGVTDRTAACA